jgi:hypothetical protein
MRTPSTTPTHDEAPACAVTRAGAWCHSLAAQEGTTIMSEATVAHAQPATEVDMVLSVDPYNPAVPDDVGVAFEDTAHGRHVLLTSCGGLKVEFRVPAAGVRPC